ncbi:coenzyme F420-0:L-glutamate ligase [Brevibacterium litoralis]|uniref:coenzyme F420-0:L-glutamate ligase n=1 Tax=Brevibacterium litoralis TaxID=3138935 RepID=UPI0032EB4D2F
MSGLLTAIAVPGIDRIHSGDDLVRAIATALDRARIQPKHGDTVVVASKIVAKAEGATERAAFRADFEDLVTDHSRGTVASRRYGRRPDGGVVTTRVVRTRLGTVQAAAGLDRSNTEGADDEVLCLPVDPDASAARLRSGLQAWFRVDLAVLVTDTVSRPWRQGVSDVVLGAAGFEVLHSLRGVADDAGRPMAVTVRALADEVAAAADLVRGASGGLPVAVVRGLAEHVGDRFERVPGASAGADLVRDPATDWFRWGHVEAIQRSLGATEDVDPAPHGDGEDDLLARVTRALQVTRAGRDRTPGQAHWRLQVTGAGALVRITPAPEADRPREASTGGHPLVEAALGLGALVDRLHTALFAEDLVGSAQFHWGTSGIPTGADVQVRVPAEPFTGESR